MDDYKKLNYKICVSEYTFNQIERRMDNQHQTHESVIRSLLQTEQDYIQS